jgi:protocatechuate 3,4-dioxygenase beta subunit
MSKVIPLITLPLIVFLSTCNGQPGTRGNLGDKTEDTPVANVGGSFENSEFVYMGIPKAVSAVDTSPGWSLNGDKLLITGIVHDADGKTPAPGVMLYYYQTNTEGRYLHRPDEPRSMAPNDKGQTHGYIRGWVKTDSVGRYSIYTVRPGIYPTHEAPAHIHATIKEPNNIKEYYIDDYVFDDDKLVNTQYRRRVENRAGSGVLYLVKKGNLFVGERDIFLGLNIPNYPHDKSSQMNSGKAVGEDVVSFTPFHAWGPDKGTKTCPICKYGWFHGILYYVGNAPNWLEVKNWLTYFEAESKKRDKYLKVYFVYGNEEHYDANRRNQDLETLGRELNLEKVALTYVPSFSDRNSDMYLNDINPNVGNTIVLFKRSRIVGKHIDLKPSNSNFRMISEQLDRTINEYFYMGGPKQ